MKTVGIVAEYNPFHLGHRYHIEKARQQTGADSVVVAMSGNLVQRGDLSLTDKFIRAEEAVRNGADLVLEIPVCYSCQSAEIFAKGSIEILDSLGVVDFLAFGSESADLCSIKKIADILTYEDEAFSRSIRGFLSEGMSYPLARQKALAQITGADEQSIMSSSNDILAIEYLKNLNRLGSSITPVAVKRVSSTYNDESIDRLFPSATAIRKLILENKASTFNLEDTQRLLMRSVPQGMASELSRGISEDNLLCLDDFYPELKAVMFREQTEIKRFFEVNEGIENLILRNLPACHSLEELIEKAKTKRYTRTRIRRTLLNILIGITRSDMERILGKSEQHCETDRNSRPYARVLAFNDRGRILLRRINESRDDSSADIINKAAAFEASSELQQIKLRYDRIANNMYYSKFKAYRKGIRTENDIMMSPVYIRD